MNGFDFFGLFFTYTFHNIASLFRMIFYCSTYVWETTNYNLLVKYVEQEQPDIVIEKVVEIGLPYMPDSAHFDNRS